MAIKVKQVFPSRNYITIDCKGDIKVVFNPVGNGTEGDDELLFRAGRWAFRVNDFLAGKMMPNGDKESMNRKIYSLNIVYNDEDGEPAVTTTYVDPTSVITLDGSRVSINGFNEMATLEAQSQIKSLMATKAKQTEIINAINAIDLSNLATIGKQSEIIAAIDNINTKFEKNYINLDDSIAPLSTLLDIIRTLDIENHNYIVHGNLNISLYNPPNNKIISLLGATAFVQKFFGQNVVCISTCKTVLVDQSNNITIYKDINYKNYIGWFTLEDNTYSGKIESSRLI